MAGRLVNLSPHSWSKSRGSAGASAQPFPCAASLPPSRRKTGPRVDHSKGSSMPFHLTRLLAAVLTGSLIFAGAHAFAQQDNEPAAEPAKPAARHPAPKAAAKPAAPKPAQAQAPAPTPAPTPPQARAPPPPPPPSPETGAGQAGSGRPAARADEGRSDREPAGLDQGLRQGSDGQQGDLLHDARLWHASRPAAGPGARRL